jgi:hypothetical protein
MFDLTEIHAHCEVVPNSKLQDGDDVRGQIHMIQKVNSSFEFIQDCSFFPEKIRKTTVYRFCAHKDVYNSNGKKPPHTV